MDRRQFLQGALGASLGSALSCRLRAEAGRKPRVLLRSSWQVVNIGDIAHTPGVLALLEQHLPDAEVRLWASGDLTDEVAAMEHRRFPELQIVKGSIGEDGRGSNPELDETVRWADFLLHGSGPSLVAERDVRAFVRHTGKPFGVYGITYGGGSEKQIELLSQARFVFFRDSVSLAQARMDEVASPIMEFGPDGAFACDLRNDEAAESFLAEHGLESGKFVCCIPRLRYTPYWLIKAGRAKDESKEARNQEMDEHDHAPLRDAIAAVVRETGLKVLVCPEDMTQMAVGKRLIVDRLPADVARQVVWREQFWLTDMALSTYVRSAGLFGLEMHSPIMCIGNGIPAIVCRFAEQTSKGFMWRDVGLGDWLFDADDPDRMQAFTSTVLEMVTDKPATARAVEKAQAVVRGRQQETMQVVGTSIPKS
ncbi:MAG: polysaccharide pyruvyl transferase family protein [Planctomycetaceae bacterium]|nr:polysaccharide pyruvyl transferase family protein [Planctomycetaceae bacterium]